MAGLLDFINTPQGMGLLSAVAGGMAGARKGTPWNNVGRGLVTGVQGYAGAQQQLRADSDNALAKQYKQMQIQEIERKIADQQAMRDAGKAAAGSAMPTQYMVEGNPFANRAEAESAAAPQTEYTPAPQNFQLVPGMTGQADPLMTFTDYSPEMVAGMGKPKQIVEQPGKFDPAAYRTAYSKQLADRGMYDEAAKYAPEKVKPVVLGKTLINPETGETIAIDDTWKEEQAASREQRIEELNMRLEDQRLNREQQIALRRELADQQAALRRDLAGQAAASRRDLIAQGNKPPSGYRYTPNGNLEQIPGGPADLKRQAQIEGGGTVDTVVADLRDMYSQLDEGGGITTTKNRWGSNIGAGIQSSGAGQAAGRLFGTENQSLRNTVAQKRPLLLQAIMKATGMTAKQMDSNTELKLYLSTATDPQLDLETNRRALDMIEKLYGSGAGNAPIAQDGKPKASPKGKTVSLADIQATARSSGKTTAEVTAAFRAKGYQIR